MKKQRPQKPELIVHVKESMDESGGRNFRWCKKIKARYFMRKSKEKGSDFSISHTAHSYARSKARGFSANDIIAVLDFGEVVCKQNFLYHFITRRSVPETLPQAIKERIMHMVVVTDYYCKAIITCYKSPNAARRIRRKPKALLRDG